MILNLNIRKYLYSSAGSQAAVDTMLMAPLEAIISGLKPDELLRARGAGIIAIIGGIHLIAKFLREKSLKFFNITDNIYKRGIHDSLFFSITNGVVSGTIYYPYIAGCDKAETIIATSVSSLAYLIGGWYIGQGMDKANTIKEEPELEVETQMRVIHKKPKTAVSRWYWSLPPRKQLWTNIAGAAAILTMSTIYAATKPQYTTTKPQTKTLENKIETWIDQRAVFQHPISQHPKSHPKTTKQTYSHANWKYID